MAIEYINDDNNTINNILNIKIVDNVSIIYNNRYRNINCYCKRGGEFRFPQLGSRFNAIFVSVLSKNRIEILHIPQYKTINESTSYLFSEIK